MLPTHLFTTGVFSRVSGLAVVLATATTVTACNGDEAAVSETETITLANNAAVENPLTAVYGATEIPYPVYPNGNKYRVGGENGLKIVVFETEDSFDTVDAYYKDLSEKKGMPRLSAMNDYVRYSSQSGDEDPWATYRPGIVIHEFNDDGERAAVGATDTARTNIIMSF